MTRQAEIEPRAGDLIFYRDRTDFGVARVDLVRERHFTCFPWHDLLLRFDKRRQRIDRHRVIARLSQASDPAAIAARLNVLRNQRDGQRAAAHAAYLQSIEKLTKELV
ncbi:hypothetical protein [Allopontixanthobacter sp.]|uniref:hypothetical protein n=1 Tax=Allopontixanthobacter sp. TaxID=2906452 RepID=UPI002ABA2377|nr:hypothetical protein [Allopontixanthobacter sp.]MDZ4308408.1 hypothetical protein [Allopontixanthobacter sp.]